MPSLITSEVAEVMSFLLSNLLIKKKKKKGKSFNNDNQYEIPQKHSSYPITLTLQKQGWWNVKNKNALIIVRTVYVVARLQWGLKY